MGHVTDLQLKEIYRKAAFSIYPSLYEGFGIPIIESLLCGTKVITTNRSAMPEASSGLAELIDPDNPDQLRNVMLKLLKNFNEISQKEVLDMREKFSTKSQAKAVLKIYNRVLQDKK